MNLKRTTTMVVAGGALIAWLAGAATSNHPIPDVPVVQQTSIDKRGAELAIEIERLHERLTPAAAPSTPSRNLFAFHAAAIRQQTAPAAPAPRAALSETPVPIALPPLKLSGIAEDAGADGPVRMAFINGGGELFMVKEGDTVTPRYRVVKISGDVVELTDVIDNSTRRLALR
jgi:Tfp pilus assembly protein PilP